MKFVKLVFSIIFSFILLFSNSSLEAAVEEQINLYISGPKEMAKLLEAEFEKEYGDVLNVYHSGSGPLRQKVWTEMLAGSIQADIVWGAEPMMYQALKEKGVLLRYRPPMIQDLKKEYIYGDGYFTAVNARYGVIVYNKERVLTDEIPTGWADLLDRRWHQRLGIADASQSSTALAITSGLYQLFDYSWILYRALGENEVMLTKQNIDVVSKIETAELDLGIAPHDGVLRLINKAKKRGIESPLGIIWPVEGIISIQRPIAIIKKERSLEADNLVKKFVDFSLSETGQNIATRFGFITVRNGLKLPEGVPQTIEVSSLDWKYASKHQEEIRATFKEIMFTD
ncbi:MAG: extracellular solute-binding protein [Halanaerobiales bacterium]|nr:extracellular solute-binding protein [Halanaerobiales bacterium]